jgi:hypothetical protein
MCCKNEKNAQKSNPPARKCSVGAVTLERFTAGKLLKVFKPCLLCNPHSIALAWSEKLDWSPANQDSVK